MTLELSFEKSYQEVLCLLRQLSLYIQVCIFNRVVYISMCTYDINVLYC